MVEVLKSEVQFTGDLPAKPVILTLHIDKLVSTLQLTDDSGDAKFSGSYCPEEGAVKTFWGEVILSDNG